MSGRCHAERLGRRAGTGSLEAAVAGVLRAGGPTHAILRLPFGDGDGHLESTRSCSTSRAGTPRSG